MLNALVGKTEIFLLVFVRMTGLFVIAPIFGRRNIPAYTKIGLSLLLAVILTATVKLPGVVNSDNMYVFSFIIVKEFLVGLLIGYIAYLIFSAIYIAGQLIDMQIGFGMVNVIDPMSNIQVPITSNFYFIVCMLIFLTVDGHHLLIKALFDSYVIVPPGEAVYNSKIILQDLVKIFGNIFFIAFKISAPVVAAILISDMALGIIMRTVPQLNIFIVGLPIKIFLGILVMIATIAMFKLVVNSLIGGMNREVINLIKHLKAG